MKRIASFVVAAVLVFLAPSSAAQPPARVPTLGYIAQFSMPGGQESRAQAAFVQGLRGLGYVDGRNIALEVRYTEGRNERLPDIAAELVARKVDVIVTETGTAAMRAREATRTIPIVMLASNDAVGQGIVVSLERPGGNVTGLTSITSASSARRLQLLAEVVPGLTEVGVLWWGPGSAVGERELAETRAAADALKIRLHLLEARDAAGVAQALAEAVRLRLPAMVAFDVNVYGTPSAALPEQALRNRLPMVFHDAGFVRRGGLLAYGTDSVDLARRAAGYVDRILKGANPGELAVGTPDKFVLVVNLGTAKALGLTIPPSILARAEAVDD